MRVAVIVGARPQFIKSAPVIRALQKCGLQQFLIHTGQHYDYRMSQIFFGELGIPEPNVNLEVGSGPHGRQIGQMLIRLEEALQTDRPDWVLVLGDTNSTLAGALAASKLRIPVAHVEAGLRSFNKEMPEEHNRIVADHCSDLLFCPTRSAVQNLSREGLIRGVHLVGDVMYDALTNNVAVAQEESSVMETLDARPQAYVLATVHRAGNTDRPEALRAILDAFGTVDEPVIFPTHPRVRKALTDSRITVHPNVRLIEPLGHLDTLLLVKNARVVVTDSGGLQKEAFWLGVPCVTLRNETEWTETVESGWNRLVGTEPERIRSALLERPKSGHPSHEQDGEAARRIVQILAAASQQ